MGELNMVLDRVRLTMNEFHTAVAELEGADGPDPEYEEEKEEKEKRKKEIIRKRKLRRKKRQAAKGEDAREEGENIEFFKDGAYQPRSQARKGTRLGANFRSLRRRRMKNREL